MNKKEIRNFEIKDKSLVISTPSFVKKVKFPFEVKQAEVFDEVLVVRLRIPVGNILNENIFGVSYDGKIIWQIEVVSHVHKNSPYTWIGRKDSLLEAYNWDGTLYIVDPNNGKIIDERFIK